MSSNETTATTTLSGRGGASIGLASATAGGISSSLNASSLMPLSANQVGNPAQPGGGAYPSSVPLINLMSAGDSNYNSNGTAAGADESM